MTYKLISIIIPVYNHEKYILECLNSINDLTYPNIELIIINDGSTDDSHNIIDAWISCNSSLKVKYINQKNKGVCKTLNIGIHESSGEYITICASDDMLSQQGLSQRYELLEQNTDKMAVIGDAFLIDSNSNVVSDSAMVELYSANYNNLKSDIKSELVLNWSVVGPTFFASRRLYDLIGFYDESLLVEDRDFYLRIISKDLLLFIEENVASYRVHGLNSSRTSKENHFNVLNQVALSNVKNICKFNSINKAYLTSYYFDLYITSKPYSLTKYYILFIYRGLRKALAKLYLKLK